MVQGTGVNDVHWGPDLCGPPLTQQSVVLCHILVNLTRTSVYHGRNGMALRVKTCEPGSHKHEVSAEFLHGRTGFGGF